MLNLNHLEVVPFQMSSLEDVNSVKFQLAGLEMFVVYTCSIHGS